MFAERFHDDNWKILYFGALSEEYSKRKGKSEIEKLIDRKTLRKVSKNKNDENQLGLFVEK